MNAIEDSLQQLDDKISEISKQVASQVIRELQAPDGIIAQQSVQINSIQTAILRLADQLNRTLDSRLSPVHEQPQPDPSSAASPDRKKSRTESLSDDDPMPQQE